MSNDIKGGAHLGEMRRWIQWHALNGDTVTWGSRDVLRLKDVTPGDLDRLAQDIRDAVLREFKVNDTDHQYRYAVFCEAGCAAFQFADTIAEIRASAEAQEGLGAFLEKRKAAWIAPATQKKTKKKG